MRADARAQAVARARAARDAATRRRSPPPRAAVEPATRAARRRAGGRRRAASLFLRADRLEGNAERRSKRAGQASSCARAARRCSPTGCRTTSPTTRSGRRATSRSAAASTGSPAPSSGSSATREIGFFTTPRFFVARERTRAATPAEIRFAGPDRYEATRRAATRRCVAPQRRLVPAERASSRSTSCARSAPRATRRVYFIGRAGAVLAVARVPAVQRAQVRASSRRRSARRGMRGFEVAAPYYFNLAPNYDATITPRLMTKRGAAGRRQFRYLFGDATPWQAPARRMPKCCPTTASPTRRARRSSWQHNAAVHAVARRLRQLQQGLRRHLFRRLRRPRRGHVAEDAAARGGLVATHGPLAAARARAELPDAAGSRTAPVMPPYNRLPQVLGTLHETDWLGLTWSGIAEYARLPAGRARRRPASALRALSDASRWTRQGAAWFVTARAGVHMRAVRSRPADALRCPTQRPTSRSRSRASTAGSCSSATDRIFGTRLRADARAARVLRLHPVSATRTRRRSSTPRSTTSTSRSCSRENRYLGNDRIGDANQLTLALTSRLLDPATGAERCASRSASASTSQDQQVTLNEAPRSAATSDFLVRRRGPAVRRVVARRACCSTTSTRRRSSASTSASATRPRRARR